MKDLSGLRIAAYARYSSEKQDEGSIDAQFLLLQRYVNAHGGNWLDVETFSDAAESGASLERPGVQNLLTRIHKKAKDFDVIMVESIDRLSRTVSDTARLCDELDFADVRLIAVSESIDTDDPNARLTLHIKASLAQQFLKELGDKTRRGLHGRAAKGFCTGGLPYGYVSVPNLDQHGKSSGSDIKINEDAALIVLKIYDLWIAGHSYLDIAGRLNDEAIPTPRASTAKRGWLDSTVRAILLNPAYIGQWKFGSKRWTKKPGTKKRRYKDSPADQVQHFERPELRIIDDRTWREAQARLQAVAGKFRGKKSAAPVRRTRYPLSGILFCGACQGPMSIIGGSSARYYRCTDSHKRKTCPTCHPLREDHISTAVISLVKERTGNPAAIAYLAETLKKQSDTRSQRLEQESKPLEASLRQVTRKIDNLVNGLASGELSGVALAPVQKALEAAEGQRRTLQARLEAMTTTATETEVPTVPNLTERAQHLIRNLDALLMKDATEAREALRKFFFDGKIYMYPTDDGGWRAETRFCPTILLSKPTKNEGPGGSSRAIVYSLSCAGRI